MARAGQAGYNSAAAKKKWGWYNANRGMSNKMAKARAKASAGSKAYVNPGALDAF